MADPRDFYDGLAADHHALFDDWWTAAQWHGQVVASLLRYVESDGRWRVSAHEPRYRALGRAVLTSAVGANGFRSVEWLRPPESGYYQPVLIARAA